MRSSGSSLFGVAWIATVVNCSGSGGVFAENNYPVKFAGWYEQKKEKHQHEAHAWEVRIFVV
jgi:hypothetical protein